MSLTKFYCFCFLGCFLGCFWAGGCFAPFACFGADFGAGFAGCVCFVAGFFCGPFLPLPFFWPGFFLTWFFLTWLLLARLFCVLFLLLIFFGWLCGFFTTFFFVDPLVFSFAHVFALLPTFQNILFVFHRRLDDGFLIVFLLTCDDV